MMTKTKKKLFSAILSFAVFAAVLIPQTPLAQNQKVNVAEAAEDDLNYAKLLQYSLYFYDGNMCGDMVTERSGFTWRNDCHLQDKAITTPYGVMDLSGGYHDAGDHIKFGLPIAYSMATLNLAYYEFKDAFVKTDTAGHLQRLTDHYAEYLRKCIVWNDANTAPKAFCYQVGNGAGGAPGSSGDATSDHSYWGPPEKQTATSIGGDRRAYFVTDPAKGADQLGAAAAVLAANYVNFKNPEDLKAATALYNWIQSSGSKDVTNTANINTPFYASSKWKDKVALTAEWLYIATNENKYKTESAALSAGTYDHHTDNPADWDGQWPQVNALRGDWTTVNTNLVKVSSRISSGNMAYFAQKDWGSTRYNASNQFLGLIADSHNSTKTYSQWANAQMTFILGKGNGNTVRSYVIGYGDVYAKQAHHRAASGYEWAGFNANAPHNNIFYGALIGGPGQDGSYKDIIKDYEYTEVACDYNAGLVGAAAGLYLQNQGHQTVNMNTLPGIRAIEPETPCEVCGKRPCECPCIHGKLPNEVCLKCNPPELCATCGQFKAYCACLTPPTSFSANLQLYRFVQWQQEYSAVMTVPITTNGSYSLEATGTEWYGNMNNGNFWTSGSTQDGITVTITGVTGGVMPSTATGNLSYWNASGVTGGKPIATSFSDNNKTLKVNFTVSGLSAGGQGCPHGLDPAKCAQCNSATMCVHGAPKSECPVCDDDVPVVTTPAVTSAPPSTTTTPPTTTNESAFGTTTPSTTTTPSITTTPSTTTTPSITTTPSTTTPPSTTTAASTTKKPKEPIPVGCDNNCGYCFSCPVVKGHIINNHKDINIGDALEVLMFICQFDDSIIKQGGSGSRPWNAAMVSGGSVPGIADVMQILMYLAYLPNTIGTRG